MSNDRRPARVRVVSSGGPGALPAAPQRRSSDHLAPDVGTRKEAERAPVVSVAAIVLFLVCCAIGGALFVLSGLAR